MWCCEDSQSTLLDAQHSIPPWPVSDGVGSNQLACPASVQTVKPGHRWCCTVGPGKKENMHFERQITAICSTSWTRSRCLLCVPDPQFRLSKIVHFTRSRLLSYVPDPYNCVFPTCTLRSRRVAFGMKYSVSTLGFAFTHHGNGSFVFGLKIVSQGMDGGSIMQFPNMTFSVEGWFDAGVLHLSKCCVHA